jgi:hypothetical protein
MKNKNLLKSKNGSALAYALVIMAIAMIILTSMLNYTVSQIKFSSNRKEKEEAFQIAEAGIYFYRWYLAHQTAGKTAREVDDFWQNSNPLGVHDPYEEDFKDPEGGVIGKYKIEAERPASGSTIVIVKSTGWTNKEPNLKRTVQVRFRRPSWSEYAVLANDFMRFGQGTEVFGKIHSNKGIRFDGTVHNIVSSLVTTFDDPDHSGGNEFGVHTHVNAPPGSGVNNSYRPLEAPPNPVQTRSDVFLIGRQFPVPEVSFTGVSSDLSFMKTQAQSGHGRYFDNTYGRRIVLKSDGAMDVCNVNAYDNISYSITSYNGVIAGATGSSIGTNGSSCTTTSCCSYNDCGWIQPSSHKKGKCVSINNYTIPNNGIVFVENNIWVEGTIDDKKVTIIAADTSGGTSRDVYIGLNNLLYTNFDGRDIIGLIAQNNISVIRDSLSTLTIDAALLAQSGRVGRDHYSSSYDKNTITINGSMATNIRYGFAYTDGTGYDNRILNFDNNLLYYPPPYFPTGTDYFIDLWEEL